MTIESRNIPSANEILEYVPSSTYVKNQMSNNRRIVKISPDNNNLRGDNFPNNAIANFTIPYSTSTLLNLSECYFDVSGIITPYLNDNPVVHNQTIKRFKAGPFWLLPCIQRATLKIGGEVIYDNLLPFRTAKFKEMMYYDYNDKQNQTLDYQNIPKLYNLFDYLSTYSVVPETATMGDINGVLNHLDTILSIFSVAAITAATDNTYGELNTVINNTNTRLSDLTKFGINVFISNPLFNLNAADKTAVAISVDVLKTFIGCVNTVIMEIGKQCNMSDETCEILSHTSGALSPYFQIVDYDLGGGDHDYKLHFQQYLKLSDLFPCESMKPIFGQSVVLTLNFESDGYNGIAIDSIAGVYNNLRITRFTQFNFNTITYNLNVDMVNKLNQIYSKPVLEIIDDITVWDGSLLKTRANSSLQLKVPISINFETDMCCLILPQSSSNTQQLKQEFNLKYANTTCHTIMDYRFINYQRIDVYADSDLIYTHNYADAKVNPGGIINNIVNLTSAGGHQSINNFIPAYHLYKECRWCCGSDERGAIPYDDFLSTGFMICIPMSAFSRISTSAQLQINITMGDGVEDGVINAPSMISLSYTDATSLDIIRVITKAKKGIVFEGLDKCSLKTITQSFDQEINVEIKPENQ